MNNENFEMAKHYAEEIEKVVSGDFCYFEGDLIPFEEAPEDCERASIYDYFEHHDIFNIRYYLDGYKDLEAVRVMIACGGPNVFINTDTEQIEVRWWTEKADYLLSREASEEIFEYFNELFNC